MSVLSRLRSFTRAALLRARSEREVDAELEFHLTARTDDLIASGLSPAAARERARRELGDARRWQEAARESRGLAWLDGVRSDGRFAYRQLRRSGAFAAGAILSMALAIGANTAIFSLVNAVLIERLPVPDPGTLVLLGVTSDAEALGSSFPYPFYRQLRDSRDALASVVASASMRPTLEDDAAAEPVTGELVSGNYFDVLGVQPYLGRLISETDEQTRAAVIVLDYGYWSSRYGGDRTIVGRSVRLNRQPMTIIGVTPPEFHGIEPGAIPRLRVPITLQAAMHGGQSRLDSPREWWLQIIGRVKPGIARTRATEALGREYEHFVAQLPAPYDRTQQLVLIDGSHGRPTLQRQFRKPLMVLTGLVAIVLILVCVNVGNLMLARGTTRQREMSLRLALGASRLRILRQLIVEALVLAVAGGTLGLWLSIWGARALAILSASPPGVAIPIDLRVLTFATLTTVLTGVLCGLAPAWSSRRASLVATLKMETAQITRDRLVGRQLLVAGQIALSLVLVVGAGLFARTLFNLRHAGFGFETERLALVTLNPGLAGYPTARQTAFYDDVLRRISASPNVESAAIGMMPLLAGDRWGSGLTVDTGERDDTPGPLRNAVGPGFFRTVGIPLLEGREFTALDAIGSEPVAIVNEAFARRYFGTTRALGRRIGEGGPNGAARHTIVGVTRDNKVAEIREQPTAFWYVPAAQLTDLSQATLHVRSTGTPEQALADIKRAVAEIDRNVPVLEAATMRQQIEDQVLTERLLAVLAGVFAGLAVLLAWIGLYAVMSYITSGRLREIGIRMALGASPLAILRLITTQSALVIASGIACGAVASWLGARQVRSLLFDLDPADAETMFLAVGVVLVATALAAVLPARRASRVNPAITLR